MVQRLLSILILTAALVLPTMAGADHRAQPIQTRLAQAGLAQAGPGPSFESLVPRARSGPQILGQQGHRKGRGGGGRDHDRARDAVSAGNVLPLQQILRQIGGRYPGRLLDANLARNAQGNWVYHLKLLAPGDKIQRLQVDARSGRLLQGVGRR